MPPVSNDASKHGKEGSASKLGKEGNVSTSVRISSIMLQLCSFKTPNFSALVYSFSILPLKSVQVYLRISTDDVVSQPVDAWKT